MGYNVEGTKQVDNTGAVINAPPRNQFLYEKSV